MPYSNPRRLTETTQSPVTRDIIQSLREKLLSLKRHVLGTLLAMVSSTAALAANDGIPTPPPGGMADTTQGPATTAPPAGACRKAKVKSGSQLTPEQKAQRKAARQAMHGHPASQDSAQETTRTHEPRPAKLPLC